jgi:hypothetical protein
MMASSRRPGSSPLRQTCRPPWTSPCARRPNPFNPATTISFQAPTAGPARLAIYDLQGRLVEVLLDGDVAAGPVQREWRPSGQASGVFMARLECGGAVATRRLALVR